ALAQQTISHLQKSSPIYTKQVSLVALSSLYKTLFKSHCLEEDIIQYLLDSLALLAPHLFQKVAPVLSTEKEAWYQLHQQLSKLQQVLVQLPAKEALQDFIQLFRQLATPIQLSLNRESLEAIQVLPMWETSNLDFDNVFILGMNEGTFPTSTTQGSFIPYNLRKGYGLPTADTFQASLGAYYFYRLLQRSQNIYITYSTNGNQGEMSRYLWQLLYEADLSIERRFVAPTIQVHTASPIIIKKDELVLQALDKFIIKPGEEPHRLTPSALNTYLDCSLKFYFRYIANLLEAPQIQEGINAMLFGSLLHKVIETLYTPLVQQKPHQFIQQEDIAALNLQVVQAVQATFARTLHQGKQELIALQGQHAIAQEIITKLVQKILEVDKAYAPFELIGLEVGRTELLGMDFELDHDRIIGLRGTIDRIDRKEGTIRVLDYKTSIDEKKIEHIASLFDRHTHNRSKAAFQTLYYAWLFKYQGASSHKILPGIINTRSIFKSKFDPRFSVKKAGKYTYIEDITPYQAAFEAGLRSVLDELLAPATPFMQTENVAQCTVCPYRGICQRY
ncbi:MAG: PD-(D/E)XK nuclease family protein, partial [Bacteroidota bacterium]